MRLYEFLQEEQHLNELFLAAIDEETGEIKDAEILEELETELKNALVSKSAGIIKVIRQQEADVEMVEAEIERLKTVKARLKKGIENFENYIKYNMVQMNVKKIETPLGNLSITQRTAVDPYDESLIPKEFMKEETKYSPKKIEIKKAIEAGEEVPGARLIINTNFKIK